MKPIIRSANQDDIPFIYSTWLNSMRYDSAIGKQCRNSIFFDEYKQVIDRILKNENTTVKILSIENEPNVIISYAVLDLSATPTIHFCYTRDPWKRMGMVGRLIVEIRSSPNLVITHKTHSLEPIMRKYASLIYNPFQLYMK